VFCRSTPPGEAEEAKKSTSEANWTVAWGWLLGVYFSVFNEPAADPAERRVASAEGLSYPR